MMTRIEKKQIACLWLGDGRVNVSQAIAEACYCFTPVLAVRPHQAVFLDCSHGLVPSTVELQQVCSAWEVPVRIGWGQTAAEALVRARFVHSGDFDALPLEALIDIPSPFAERPDVASQIGEMVRVLRRLGLQNIGDFKHLPSETLPSRFGEMASHVIRMLAAGEAAEAWPRFVPAEEISESIDFTCMEGGVALHSLEPLFFILKKMSDRIFQRLHGRAQKLSAFDLKFVLDDRSQRLWTLHLPIAQAESVSLLPIVYEKLNHALQVQPLSSPVFLLHMRVLETQDFRGSQRDFFQRREEERQSLEALLARLYARLNEDDIFYLALRERYLPESAWKKMKSVPGTAQDAKCQAPLSLRPSRLLSQPQRISRQGDVLLHFSERKRWKIISWEGPERLSGEWWEAEGLQGFFRDYYRVQCEAGECLWVFTSPEDRGLYLHGYFD